MALLFFGMVGEVSAVRVACAELLALGGALDVSDGLQGGANVIEAVLDAAYFQKKKNFRKKCFKTKYLGVDGCACNSMFSFCLASRRRSF